MYFSIYTGESHKKILYTCKKCFGSGKIICNLGVTDAKKKALRQYSYRKFNDPSIAHVV